MPGDPVILRTYTNRHNHEAFVRRKNVVTKEHTKKIIKWTVLSGWDDEGLEPTDDALADWIAKRKGSTAVDMHNRPTYRRAKWQCLQPCLSIFDYNEFEKTSLSDTLYCTPDTSQLESPRTAACESKPVLAEIAKWPSRTPPSVKVIQATSPRSAVNHEVRASSVAATYIDGVRDKTMYSRCNSAMSLTGTRTRAESFSRSRDESSARGRHDTRRLETTSVPLISRKLTPDEDSRRDTRSDCVNNLRTVTLGSNQQSHSLRSRSAMNHCRPTDVCRGQTTSADGVLKLARDVLQSRPQSTPVITAEQAHGTPSMRFTKVRSVACDDSNATELNEAHVTHRHLAPTLTLKTVSVQNKIDSEKAMSTLIHHHVQPPRVVEQNVVCKQKTATAQEPTKCEAGDNTSNCRTTRLELDMIDDDDDDDPNKHDDVLRKLAIPFHNSLAAVREGMKLLRIKEHTQSLSGPAGFRPTKMKTSLQTVKASALRAKYKCVEQRKGSRCIRPGSASRPSNVDSNRLREIISMNEILSLESTDTRRNFYHGNTVDSSP